MIDLHSHSTVSDGTDTPAEVVALGAAAGLTALALTDHDTLEHLPEARAAARRDLRLVPGCEISCEWSPGTMHVLVYFVEPGEGPLQDELVRLQRVREARNERMCEVLGIPYDELLAEAGGIGAGRPHAAAILVRRGVAESIPDAFDRFLGKGKPGYVEKERLAPSVAVRMARESGGVAVLAHPFSLGLTPSELDGAVDELAALGFAGIEAVYGGYLPEDRAGLVALAERHGLVATGGSDHHGAYKPDLTVGTGRGDLDVPDSVLDDLAARRPS